MNRISQTCIRYELIQVDKCVQTHFKSSQMTICVLRVFRKVILFAIVSYLPSWNWFALHYQALCINKCIWKASIEKYYVGGAYVSLDISFLHCFREQWNFHGKQEKIHSVLYDWRWVLQDNPTDVRIVFWFIFKALPLVHFIITVFPYFSYFY